MKNSGDEMNNNKYKTSYKNAKKTQKSDKMSIIH